MRVPQPIVDLASRQHGVVTSAQLHGGGLDRGHIYRLERAGILHHLHRGVYALGHLAPDDRRRWSAAVLATSPGAALTGRSGARCLGISRRRRDRTHVVVPHAKRPRAGMTISQPSGFHPDDVIVHDGIRVASLPWLLLHEAPHVEVGELVRMMREYAF